MTAGFDIHRKSKPPEIPVELEYRKTGKTITSVEAETHFNNFISPAVNVINKH